MLIYLITGKHYKLLRVVLGYFPDLSHFPQEDRDEATSKVIMAE